MINILQQKILKNVVDSTLADEKSCIIHFSRSDKVEISLIKNIFDLDVIVRGIKPADTQKIWSEMINSSQLDATFEAQAQYVNIYMKELFSDIKIKNIRKP